MAALIARCRLEQHGQTQKASDLTFPTKANIFPIYSGIAPVSTFGFSLVAARTVETPIVKKFKETGVNDYRADVSAIADGRNLYIVCHGADGTGKMGPTLVGKDVVYKQVLTAPAMFASICGRASVAMQSFHRRGMKQDEMLRIIAYVRTLDK